MRHLLREDYFSSVLPLHHSDLLGDVKDIGACICWLLVRSSNLRGGQLPLAFPGITGCRVMCLLDVRAIRKLSAGVNCHY